VIVNMIKVCIIFRGQGQLSPAELEELEELKQRHGNIRYYFQKNAWADSEFMAWWLRKFVKDIASKLVSFLPPPMGSSMCFLSSTATLLRKHWGSCLTVPKMAFFPSTRHQTAPTVSLPVTITLESGSKMTLAPSAGQKWKIAGSIGLRAALSHKKSGCLCWTGLQTHGANLDWTQTSFCTLSKVLGS
jgi:hypothetical protein